MDDTLEELYRLLISSAAQRLTGYERRQFIAEVTLALCEGNPRQSERLFGWSRDTAALGLHEAESGLHCVGDFHKRGRKPSEQLNPQLAQDIRDLVEPKTQTDPQFKSDLRYTRITATAVRKALIDVKGYRDEELPGERALQNILKRMGYRLRRVQKTKPLKKVKQTDAIFENVQQVHEEAQKDAETLEISIDTKAKVQLGEYSRDGEARTNSDGKPLAAWDHDPPAKKKGCHSES
jgi:hypothetical protein